MKAPTAFVCSRQGLKSFKKMKKFMEMFQNGGYLLKAKDNAHYNNKWKWVMFALQTVCALEKEGIITNIVSVPLFDLLLEQSERL